MHTCFQLQPEGSCLFVFKSGVGVDGEVEVLVKDDVASAVAPAADIDCDADRGGMTGSILDIDAHDGELAAHALCDGETDGSHQCSRRSVGHKVGHHTTEDENNKGNLSGCQIQSRCRLSHRGWAGA